VRLEVTIRNLFALTIIGLFGCRNQHLESHRSPSGLYNLEIELGNRNDSNDKYILMFKLAGKDGNELGYLRTGASDIMKWAVTWHNDSIIVLNSHDIGTYAWTVIQNGKLVPVEDLSQELIDEGERIFNKKYND
jgi:hypothetical protein